MGGLYSTSSYLTRSRAAVRLSKSRMNLYITSTSFVFEINNKDPGSRLQIKYLRDFAIEAVLHAESRNWKPHHNKRHKAKKQHSQRRHR